MSNSVKKAPLVDMGDTQMTIALARGASPSAIERAAFMAPGSQKKKGTADFFSSSLNLIKTIMGTGMLCLPAAFQAIGVIPALGMLIFAAFLSAFGLFLLTCAVERVGGRDVDFSTLSTATYPNLGPLFDFTIMVKCIGVGIGYLVVIGDLIPQLLKGVTTNHLLTNSTLWMTLTAVLISPIIFMPKMDSLKYTSFLGMISVVYIVGLSVVLFISTPDPVSGSHWGRVSLWEPFSKEYIKNFSVFIFSFTCHQNMLPIQNEAKKNSSLQMSRVISVCTGLALVLYASFGLFSYAVFGLKPIEGNFLNIYPTIGLPYYLARLLFIFLVIFSFPLQTFPARSSALKLMTALAPKFSAKREREIYLATTSIILTLIWLTAITGLDLRKALRIVGSTAGPVLCYLLPAVFWIKLEEGRPWKGNKTGAAILLVSGIVITVISTVALFIF